MALRIPTDLSQRFERYGISLGRLTAAELETLRQRRNDPAVAQFMIYRDHITPEQQAAWFATVDNRDNLYGTLYWKGELIGLTNLRDIDPAARSAEGGMIIWAEQHQNSLVPFRAAIVGTDLAFWDYGFERITCRVLASNRRAIRFNGALGYRFDPPDASGVQLGWVIPEHYWAATRQLRAMLDEQDGTVNGGWPVVPPPPRDE